MHQDFVYMHLTKQRYLSFNLNFTHNPLLPTNQYRPLKEMKATITPEKNGVNSIRKEAGDTVVDIEAEIEVEVI